MNNWSSLGGPLGAVLLSEPQAAAALRVQAHRSFLSQEYADMFDDLRILGWWVESSEFVPEKHL
jgi:hypothetical protein